MSINETLPIAFGNMTGGRLIGPLFFVLLFFGAWTSAISLMEPTVAWLTESKKMHRVKATVWTGTVIWFIGLASIFSFSGTTLGDILRILFSWVGFEYLELNHWFFKQSLFIIIDFLTASIMLPLGGLLIALFAGWVMERESTEREFSFNNRYVYPVWHIMIRYVAPFLVFIVFLNITGIFNF